MSSTSVEFDAIFGPPLKAMPRNSRPAAETATAPMMSAKTIRTPRLTATWASSDEYSDLQGSRFQVPGSRFGFWFAELEPEPEPWNLEPGTWNFEPLSRRRRRPPVDDVVRRR